MKPGKNVIHHLKLLFAPSQVLHLKRLFLPSQVLQLTWLFLPSQMTTVRHLRWLFLPSKMTTWASKNYCLTIKKLLLSYPEWLFSHRVLPLSKLLLFIAKLQVSGQISLFYHPERAKNIHYSKKNIQNRLVSKNDGFRIHMSCFSRLKKVNASLRL